jgi:hypothetical protein
MTGIAIRKLLGSGAKPHGDGKDLRPAARAGVAFVAAVIHTTEDLVIP